MIGAVIGFFASKMRRAKAIATANVTTNLSSLPSVEKALSSSGASQASNSPGGADPATPTADPAAVIQDSLKELHKLIHDTQGERSKAENNLGNIGKTHERMQSEQKMMSPYYRSKLNGMYKNASNDSEKEAEFLRQCLDKIAQIKAVRNEQRLQAKNMGLYGEGEGPRKTMRRGVLMTMLQQAALTLPLWIGRTGESPPPLCGCMSAESNYIAKPGDKIAARVKSDGDENWILAESVSFNTNSNKYTIDDIDEEGKEHVLSKRRVIPLPLMKANPETNPEALFKKGTLVMALYPQTTCFYRSLIDEPPTGPMDDYLVLFEDNSYADGYSPALKVAQRYVVQIKEPRKR